MKWVKASERLPETSEILVWRLTDKSNVNMGYSSKNGFHYLDRHWLNSKAQINTIEWLDESASLPSSSVTDKSPSGEGDAVEFAEWISNNQFKMYNNHWQSTKVHYHPNYYTTVQLYQLFIQSNK